MTQRPLIALAGTIVLLVGLSGIAAAAPGSGSPADVGGQVPAFVTDLIGGLGDVVGGLVDSVLEFVDGLTPDAASDGMDTARGAASR